MQQTRRLPPQTSAGVLQRYPRLTGHLICESLGYFTPASAANAISAHIRKEPFYCEWYIHMESFGKRTILAIGADTLKNAFRNRHHHSGYMAEYQLAKQIVDQVRAGGEDPVFASWF